MDNISDLIIPALVFIFWAISSVAQVAKKSKADKERPESEPYTPLDHPGNQDDERTRRIQEEIRRKIAERRGNTAPQPASRTEEPPAYNPHLPETPRTQPAPRPAARAPEPTLRRESAPTSRPAKPKPSYVDLDQPVNRLQQELAEQQRRMEETQRKAEEARQLALKRRQDAYRKTRKKPRTISYGGSLQSSVRATLKDPHAARKAVLYYETLGTPVGLRRDGQLYPHWDI